MQCSNSQMKHAACFPPSSMPASIEISIKLIVCLTCVALPQTTCTRSWRRCWRRRMQRIHILRWRRRIRAGRGVGPAGAPGAGGGGVGEGKCAAACGEPANPSFKLRVDAL